MADKKPNSPDDSEETTAAEQRVDALMAREGLDATPAVAMSDAGQAAPPEPATALPEASAAPAEAQEAYDDPAHGKAVDDVAGAESEKLLAGDDAKLPAQAPPGEPPSGELHRLRRLITNKWFWLKIGIASV